MVYFISNLILSSLETSHFSSILLGRERTKRKVLVAVQSKCLSLSNHCTLEFCVDYFGANDQYGTQIKLAPQYCLSPGIARAAAQFIFVAVFPGFLQRQWPGGFETERGDT
jgi:hypothetical protein